MFNIPGALATISSPDVHVVICGDNEVFPLLKIWVREKRLQRPVAGATSERKE